MFWKIVLFGCGVICTIGSLKASTIAHTSNAFIEVSLNTNTEQIPDTFSSKTVRIYYRVNRTEIESDYMGNAATLNTIEQIFDENSLEKGDFIVIRSSASPEGGFNNNQRLAEERALSLKNYIKQKYPQIEDKQVILLPEAEDWEGLKDMIEKDEEVPDRDQLLEILNSSLSRKAQKARIKIVSGGKSYEYLLARILPYLRGSATGTIYTKKRLKPEEIRIDTVEILRIDTICPEKEVDEVLHKQKKKYIIAAKNNLIYDVALLPNLAIEIPFGHNYNWSVAVDGNWSWWNTDADSYYYHRIQIAGVELRRWFGNKTGNPLNGWFVGAYGYGGTYDIRLFTDKNSDEGQLSNWTYSGGLTFGYAMPIAERFNIEFGLGVGYMGGKYYKYTIGSCKECIFPWKSTHQRSYVGPTKASISLVWLIGNIPNKKKGKEGWR